MSFVSYVLVNIQFSVKSLIIINDECSEELISQRFNNFNCILTDIIED